MIPQNENNLSTDKDLNNPEGSTKRSVVEDNSDENPIKHSILVRARVFYVLFFLMALSALGMIIYYQFGSQSGALKAQAVEYSFKNEIIEAHRGDILADDKRTLATSIVYYDLRMDMMAQGLTDDVFNDNVKVLSEKLADFFKDKSPNEYAIGLRLARSEKRRYYRLARRKVDYLELQQIKKFPLLNMPANKGGFIPQEMGRRVNPYGDLAGRTLGFVNTVGVKVGLEGSFDNTLKGTNGLTVKQKISGNFWIPVVNDNNIEPINGHDIVTTINVEMQNNVQEALQRRVAEMEADWGCVVVMEVQTGHIKAISNITRLKDGKLVEDYNYAIGMSLEPGSTFKVASLITLLDDAKVSLNEKFDTEDGDAQIGYVKVVDTKTGGYGLIDLGRIIEVSSNIGVAKAVNKYYGANPARFVERLYNYGLNKPLGLEIQGESKPLLKHPNLRNGWDGMTLTMMSYGYALRVSPIQTLSLYNAIANNGKMMKPKLVTSIESQGRTVKQFPDEVINEAICSPSTAKQVQSVLEGVVQEGTAKLIKNDNYRVAAKTGTAQIAMGRSGYITASGSRHYMGSIAGYFPADKPKYSMIVVMKTFWSAGSDKQYYGGKLTGPLFKEIADDIFNADLSMLKGGGEKKPVEPIFDKITSCADSAQKIDLIARNLRVAIPKNELNIQRDSIGVPNVVGVSPELAQKLLWDEGYKVITRGRGKIYNQYTLVDSIGGRKTVILNLK